MTKKRVITARDIVELLAVKHAGDVFVPECKNGPTHSTSHLRMDAWAMARSWARPRIVAYEVKVSRSDFLNDDKWRGYLPYCNELCFVCPAKVIAPEELPADVGLIVPSANCTRLYTKRKAVYRDIVIDESVLRYVLICRAQIGVGTDCAENDPSGRAEHWAAWLAKREYTADLGHQVSRALGEVIDEKIEKVDQENKRLATQIKNLQETRDLLRKLGFDKHIPDPWSVEGRLRRLREAVPPELKGDLRNARRSIRNLQKALAEIETAEPTE